MSVWNTKSCLIENEGFMWARPTGTPIMANALKRLSPKVGFSIGYLVNLRRWVLRFCCIDYQSHGNAAYTGLADGGYLPAG